MIRQWSRFTLFTAAVAVLNLCLMGCGDEGDGDSSNDTALFAMGPESGPVTAADVPLDPVNPSIGAPAAMGEMGSNASTGQEANGDRPAGTVLNGAGSSPAPEGCSRSGFQTVRSRTQWSEGNLGYSGISAEEAPYNILLVQSFAAYSGPTTPGTYDLDGINFKDCGLCLRVLTDCNDEGCQKTFYAQQGSVEITSIGREGTQFSARFNNVVFQEVDIADDLVSTPVANGETWCMNDFNIDEPIVGATSSGGGGAGGAAVNCPAGATCVGDTVSNFSLTECDSGTPTGIQDYFAGSSMGWIILTAGWCPGCAQRIPQVIELEQMYAAQGMKVMVIVGEGATRDSAVDVSYCQRYASRYQNSAGKFFVDNGYEQTFTNLFPYIGSDGVFSLPWEAIIDPNTMVYMYADRSGADIQAVANELLNGQ